jgi:hypothetical protein
MKEKKPARPRKQYYLVTEADCNALRDIQLMIVAMTPLPYAEEKGETDHTTHAPGETDPKQLLAEVRIKIGRVLDSICLHNIQRGP